MTDTNYRPTRYWEKSNELIDRLKLAREVKSTVLDGKLFQISITRSEKNDIYTLVTKQLPNTNADKQLKSSIFANGLGRLVDA